MISTALCQRDGVVNMPSAARPPLAVVGKREPCVADVASAARAIEDRL